jgi:hypothetical protein
MTRSSNVSDTRPPWAEPGAEIPSADRYLPVECFVAGAISTLPVFGEYHPAWCLPIAERALTALGEYVPPDGG